MRYVFLAIGAVAASLFWVHEADDKQQIKQQLEALPGYQIMPRE